MCRFFFQAEDGIRDIGVTGVQTCALPILDDFNIDLACALTTAVFFFLWALSKAPEPERSEERRVGKECRSRWSGHHLKKKDTSRRISAETRDWDSAGAMRWYQSAWVESVP